MLSPSGFLLEVIVLAALLPQPVGPEAAQEPGTTEPQEVVTAGDVATQSEKGPRITEPLIAVTIGGVEHLLLFEEPDIPMKTRTAIAADIQQIFAHLSTVPLKASADKERSHSERKYHMGRYWLTAPHYKTWWPEVLRTYFGQGIRHGNTYYLIIHEKLSQEYREALKLKQAHSEEFEQFHEFLALFNDREARRQAAETMEGARGFFYFHDMEPSDDYGEYLEALGLAHGTRMRIHPPSVLAFSIDKELGDALVTSCVFRYREADGDEYNQKMPFIYYNGQWRMLVVRMP